MLNTAETHHSNVRVLDVKIFVSFLGIARDKERRSA